MQFVSLAVVARLIGPSAYGSAVTALVAVTGAELIRSGGVTWLIGRTPQLTAGTTRTFHRLSVVLGVVAAGVTLGLAVVVPASALPAGAVTLPLLAVVFLCAGSSAVPTALLARGQRFGTIGGAEVGAAVLSCGVAVTVALRGGGASAPLLQAAVYAVVLCVAILLRAPIPAAPRVPLRDLRDELGFAANATAVQAMEWLARSVDRVLVAAAFGPVAAGVYAQATQLVLLPVEQVNGPLRRAAIPALARLLHDPARFRTGFRTVLTAACVTIWPVVGVLAVLAEPLVVTVFGDGWRASAAAFRLMVPMAMALTVTSVTTFAVLAGGSAARLTVWECAVSRPTTVVAYLLGARWGVHGVAVAASIAGLVLVTPGFLVVTRTTGLRLADLVRPLLEPTTTALVCGVAAVAVRCLVHDDRAALAVGAVTAACTWVVCVAALPRTRGLLRDVGSVVRAPRSRDPCGLDDRAA
ncbi:oligosaccharide flippase family protein [Curtobacterium sp. MCBD17_032]|uniref:oligosaccharide flippase family protein n=1 Tax=Curtobacterium sp. MCBD17_032 TaxID=2175659 RepID=UPI0015E8B607